MQKNIRKLNEDDAEEASALIWRVFYRYVSRGYTMRGIEEFRDFISPISLKMNTYDGFIELFGYFGEDGALEGVVGLREKKHIVLLFVDSSKHKKGIGSALVKTVVLHCTQKFLTVNASDYGKPFYEKMGFEVTSPRTVKDGIVFTPMSKSITPQKA